MPTSDLCLEHSGGSRENYGVRNYAMVIHEDPDGGFWGEVPALPGCFSYGETVDELRRNMREAPPVPVSTVIA